MITRHKRKGHLCRDFVLLWLALLALIVLFCNGQQLVWGSEVISRAYVFFCLESCIFCFLIPSFYHHIIKTMTNILRLSSAFGVRGLAVADRIPSVSHFHGNVWRFVFPCQNCELIIRAAACGLIQITPRPSLFRSVETFARHWWIHSQYNDLFLLNKNQLIFQQLRNAQSYYPVINWTVFCRLFKCFLKFCEQRTK